MVSKELQKLVKFACRNGNSEKILVGELESFSPESMIDLYGQLKDETKDFANMQSALSTLVKEYMTEKSIMSLAGEKYSGTLSEKTRTSYEFPDEQTRAKYAVIKSYLELRHSRK